MNLYWKQSAGAFVLSVAILASASGQIAGAKPIETGQLLIKDKPRPPSVEKGKSATIPVEPPTVDAPATEKGIRDNGVKSCGSCGLTSGREAAPPAADDAAAPPSVDKGKSATIPLDPPTATPTERRAHNGPGGTPPTTQKRKKSRPKERDDDVHSTSLRLPLIGGLAAISAVIVVSASGGEDKPVSI